MTSLALTEFARTLRGLDRDTVYAAWLAAKREAERERERPDLARLWTSFATVLDAWYTEAERAA